ncbi:BTAD domain-containing putative transcriptional regulator [Streptomyces sp. HPF1205]|uniref:AfsR/SARP family transcriptional regulator n=1 Tax=Streptomyces sp. HPF1205 TaxID=2873262 RepID=UPI001CED9574|nr:BTAD domain-containing putative transcriptional regulator [Streptomyces sp. HPF1205]
MRYAVLGVTQVRDGERVVPVAGGRLRALLTVLAVNAGRTLTPEELMAEVWAQDPPADAPGALQALVGRLRRVLGRDAIASEPGGYRLTADPDTVDLHRFERFLREGEAALSAGSAESAAASLDAALALWRGPALADLPDRAAASARPEALRLTAVRLRVEADLALGRNADALAALRQAVADHPLDEAFRAQLIRALRAAGRTADALVTYEEARGVLAEALGADPGPELRALHAELLRQAESPAPGPRSAALAAMPPQPAPVAKASAPVAKASGPASAAKASAFTSAPLRRPGNLRARLTSFVGREKELRSLAADLAGARLVTLTGPGGSGKTRLSQEAAEAAQDAYPDGVWLAELAPLDEPAAVPHAVLSALGRRDTLLRSPRRDPLTSDHLRPEPGGADHASPRTEQPEPVGAAGAGPAGAGPAGAGTVGPGPSAAGPAGPGPVGPGAVGAGPFGPESAGLPEDPLTRIVEHCAPRRLLLLLDNCEHLIEAAADLAGEVLAQCPGVTVLATSREPLGVPGEVVRPVEPLPPLPAYRLFAERAAAVRPGAAEDVDADADAVRVICRRLDGLPLAIELAAARLRALSPRQIADRLDDRFRLLTGGSRTLLPRQQTLRAVVDWSWDLLTEHERTTLSALTVFAGGCTLAAAEAVCGPDTLEAVTGLVDKSLLVADHGRPTGTRYRLLETIHEYAAERARERPEHLAAAEARHTAYFRDLARDVDPRLRGADQLRWLDVLETELDNVRAVLHRTITRREEEDAIATAVAMGWFWWLRNYRDEASGWLNRVAAIGDRFFAPSVAAPPAGPPAGPLAAPPDDERSGRPAAVPADAPVLRAAEPADALYWPRNDLHMLRFFVNSDRPSHEQWSAEESRETARRLAAAYGGGGPEAARFPGLLWPFTLYSLGGTASLRGHTDEVVANCRAHGGDWEVAAALMFRTHVTVDSPGGAAAADADRAELQELAARLGDRWIRAQVHSAGAEIEALRGNYEAARRDYETAYRLGRELRAYGEGPFVLARLAELAHLSGDDGTATKVADQAAEEAERYAVHDARTYIRCLQAVLLLRRGAVDEARAMYDLAAAHAADGSPPPVFRVLLLNLAARISAAEGDAPAALTELAEAARLSLELGCTEPVVASQFDVAASVLAAYGDTYAALVLGVVADCLRAELPRSAPEQEADARVRALARDRLTREEREAARATGTALDRERAAQLLRTLAQGADLGEGADPGIGVGLGGGVDLRAGTGQKAGGARVRARE